MTILSSSVSGGGGVGKSFLIKVLSAWVEYILRRHGEDPTNPKCLLLAPTGVASSLIGNYSKKCSKRHCINSIVLLCRRDYFANWLRIDEQRQLPHSSSRKIRHV